MSAGHDPPSPFADGDDADHHETTSSTTLARLRDGAGTWLAWLLAASLLLPVGAWAVDSLVFARLAGNVADAVPALADGVALVNQRGCDGTTGSGSGFAGQLDGRPVVVTNRHVVAASDNVGVRTLDGDAGPEVVEVLLSTLDDVAVLVLDQPLPGALPLGDAPGVGDELRLVGFPGARPVTSAGEVVGVEQDRVILGLTADPGASGAPLVDDENRVVAQVVARTRDGSGVAIPVDRVRRALRDLRPMDGCG